MQDEEGHTGQCVVMVTVVTLNILNDLSLWRERAPLIVEGLRAIQPDLIALQEVALPLNSAQWIADRLGGYSVYLCPKTGAKGRHETLAILSRLPVEEHATLPLVEQDRVAQRVMVSHDDRRCAFVNTHLYWNPRDDAPRLAQARRLLNWLPRGVPTIVCGDFNAEPHFETISTMRGRFASAYAARHNTEPDYTCPTPLLYARWWAFRGLRDTLKYFVLNALANHTLKPWRGTLDYIFVDRAVRVEHCEVVFNWPSPKDERLYPSDHFGLMAKIQVELQ